MPGGDRTGPFGEGPMTGRRLGFCTGSEFPGYHYLQPGRGLGRGMRRGPGYGRGWGFGPGRGGGFGYAHWDAATGVSEETVIENQIRVLKDQLSALEEQLSKLKKD